MALVGILILFSILNRVGYLPFHVLDLSTNWSAERAWPVGLGEGSVKLCYSKEDLTRLCAWCEMQTNGGLRAKASSKCTISGYMFAVHQV